MSVITTTLSLALILAPMASREIQDTTRLTLAAAVELARSSNPTLRAERAEARAAAQLPNEASTAYLPTITLDLAGMRTTDPVAVFGLKLRQGVFQQEDLALDALNNPDPYTSFNSTASIQQPLIVPEGWFGHQAANRGAAARAAAADRAAGATTFQVTRAYWDVLFAAARLAALDTALVTAEAHVAQAGLMHEQGLVTGLDARLGRLRAAEVEVRRLQADARLANARTRLRALLALPDSVAVVLVDSLAGPVSQSCEPSSSCEPSERGDLIALRLGAEAADYGVRRAWASQLPFVFGFGSVAHYSNSAPFGSGSGDWTVGIGVRWNILRGWAGPGEVARAKAQRDAAEARAEAASRQAAVEVRSAERLLEAARQRVVVAESAAREAGEALAQARLRYRTGASAITELLDVQTAATNTTLNLLAARRDLLVAAAARDFAYGANDS